MNTTLFVDNFNTAWAANAKGIKLNLKGMPARHEIREIIVEFAFSFQQGAAGPATTVKVKPNDNSASGGADDLLTIFNQLVSRIYLSRDKQRLAVNANPIELEMCYGAQHLVEMFSDQVLDGDAIPANGSPATRRLRAKISFQHEGFEVPNMLCPGTEQASLDNGWEVMYDAGAGTINPIALAGGNAIVSNVVASVHVDLAPVPWPVVAPVMFIKEDQFNNNKDEVFGPILELLFYDNRQPATMEVQVAFAFLKSDDKDVIAQQTPTQCAQNYIRAQAKLDQLRGLDISRSVTPLRWVAGKTRPEERELPFTSATGKRVYTQQLAAGGNPAVTCVRHFVLPIETNDDSIKRVMAIYRWDGDWRKFPVRFPGRDKDLEVFKAREIRPPK